MTSRPSQLSYRLASLARARAMAIHQGDTFRAAELDRILSNYKWTLPIVGYAPDQLSIDACGGGDHIQWNKWP